MKKFLLLVITGVILHNGLCFAADEDNVATAVESESAAATAQTGNQGNSNFENMGRGLINIGTCFVEIPRGLIYCNSEMPFWGFINGAVIGSGLTVMRAFSGITDIISLGFDYGNYFNDTTFCEYIWQSQWLPEKK